MDFISSWQSLFSAALLCSQRRPQGRLLASVECLRAQLPSACSISEHSSERLRFLFKNDACILDTRRPPAALV